MIGLFLGDVLTADVEVTAETESSRADDMLDRAFPQSRAERERQLTEAVVLRATSGALDAQGTREQVAELANALRSAGASEVVATDGGPLVSQDGDARVLLVALGFRWRWTTLTPCTKSWTASTLTLLMRWR